MRGRAPNPRREAWRRRCWRLWRVKIDYLAEDHRLPPRCARCVELEASLLPWPEVDLAALEIEDAAAEAAERGAEWTERLEIAHESADLAFKLFGAPRPVGSSEPREFCARCERLRALREDIGHAVDLDHAAAADEASSEQARRLAAMRGRGSAVVLADAILDYIKGKPGATVAGYLRRDGFPGSRITGELLNAEVGALVAELLRAAGVDAPEVDLVVEGEAVRIEIDGTPYAPAVSFKSIGDAGRPSRVKKRRDDSA